MKSVITQKYQVHIPAAIRKQLNLKPNMRVHVRAEKNRIILEPDTSSVLALFGTCKVKNPIPAEEIRKYLAYGEGK